MTVLAANNWPTNGHLILDVHRLGYLRNDDHVLDPTYELGTWWSRWRPEKLTALHRAVDGSDFRRLPYPDGSFDAVAFDPPYVAKGGRTTSGIKEMDRRYGQEDCPATPELLQALICEGLTEMARLSRRTVLVKCKDYISSGRFFNGTYLTQRHAIETLRLEQLDRFEHWGPPGPQPPGRRQVHSRRNLSTLFVFGVRRGG